MKVFEALQRIKDGEIADRAFGICFSVERILDGDSTWHDHTEECFTEWSEFSGDETYPVPCDEDSPYNAFRVCHPDKMWNPDHPYGAARLRLLDHCINWFKERDL